MFYVTIVNPEGFYMKVQPINLQNLCFNSVPTRKIHLLNHSYCDTANFSGAKYHYIDDNNELFDGCTSKKMRSFNDIEPENLSLIHITNYFPNNGQILSLKEASKDSDGVGQCRSTIHFSLNQSVERDNTQTNWASMKYAVIMPFDKTLEQTPQEKIIGGKHGDFFFVNNVKLPEGSKIVKYNENIQQGKFRISQAKDESGNLLNGVDLVETSDKDICAAAERVSKKMGYSTFDDLFYPTPKSKKDAARLKKILNEGDFSKLIYSSKEMDDYIELSDRVNYQKYKCAEALDNAWDNFCLNIGCENMEQGFNNPWTKSDLLIYFIGNILINFNNDSWLYENGDEKIDFKDEIIKQAGEIERMLPKGKDITYDMQRFKDIIAESDLPSEALNSIKDKLNIKPIEIEMLIDQVDANLYFQSNIAMNSIADLYGKFDFATGCLN